jgi:coenzyme PQQ precursor peptide PqqA
LRFAVIGPARYVQSSSRRIGDPLGNFGGLIMKTWMKPSVREQEVGLEVTSYLPAEIDII